MGSLLKMDPLPQNTAWPPESRGCFASLRVRGALRGLASSRGRGGLTSSRSGERRGAALGGLFPGADVHRPGAGARARAVRDGWARRIARAPAPAPRERRFGDELSPSSPTCHLFSGNIGPMPEGVRITAASCRLIAHPARELAIAELFAGQKTVATAAQLEQAGLPARSARHRANTGRMHLVYASAPETPSPLPAPTAAASRLAPDPSRAPRGSGRSA